MPIYSVTFSKAGIHISLIPIDKEDKDLTQQDYRYLETFTQLDFNNKTEQITKIAEKKHEDLFADQESDLGLATRVKHHINIGHHAPSNQRLRRTPKALKLVVKTNIEVMLSNKIIRESHSPFAAAIVMVSKKDGEMQSQRNGKGGGEEQRDAFDYIKNCLITRPVLGYPDFSRKFIIYTGASRYGIGAVLAKKQPPPPPADSDAQELRESYGVEVIAYTSKHLNDQKNFRMAKSKAEPAGKLARCALKILEFHIINRKIKRRKMEKWIELQHTDEYCRTILQEMAKANPSKDVRNKFKINAKILLVDVRGRTVRSVRLVPQILKENYNHKLAGHLGVGKTLARLQRKHNSTDGDRVKQKANIHMPNLDLITEFEELHLNNFNCSLKSHQAHETMDMEQLNILIDLVGLMQESDSKSVSYIDDGSYTSYYRKTPTIAPSSTKRTETTQYLPIMEENWESDQARKCTGKHTTCTYMVGYGMVWEDLCKCSTEVESKI
ncbi:Uncharacterized protein APZ42_033430 [Daphnia magna]|uniref:Reverse transcriptase/retrotransposon-derived protein RNase H-like domain-containing protein n=1 Tax=Daphnia magna TaxID=35525 RepID=A0A164L3E3_9CRUS|nr:Uncharacterized protein APZ42_033430 [Daphnia magna]